MGILLSVMSCSPLLAQKITISGYVTDEDTGETLIGANIFEIHKKAGAVCNVYGFYSLTLPTDTLTLYYSFVGYQIKIIHLDRIKKDTILSVKLKPITTLEEVVVRATQTEKIQEETRMSSVTLPISQIKALPAFLGEVDVLKVLQLLPGVQSSEGSTGLYVRGGGPDQNLILLDGAPVYNAAHLFGFFSVFNADAINHVELIKGGFPARYGGRLSSVVDIHMKEGNQQKIKGEGSVGIVASKFTLEGPIKKNRASFIVSGRRTYIDLLTKPLQSSSEQFGYFFYDFNAKFNYRINPNNRLFLSIYTGDDKFYSRYKDNETAQRSFLQWGNLISALRWNHEFNKKLFANFAATFTRYRFSVGSSSEVSGSSPSNSQLEYSSGIRDFAFRSDFDFVPNPSHYIRFGAHMINHFFSPGVLNFSSTASSDFSFPTYNARSYEWLAYVEDDWEVNRKLKVNAGLHTSLFSTSGKTHTSAQPRLSARYLLSRTASLKASYSSMAQFVHLLSNAGVGLPTDLWVPSTENIKPQYSKQVAIGFAQTIKEKFELTLEAYYKTMENPIEYKEGASFLSLNQDWQTKVWSGQGKSYGVECLFQKKVGNLSGWLGYTLSWNKRQFDQLNFGNWFPYRYDRRHDVKLALSYSISDRVEAGFTWVYGTGNAITMPLYWYRDANGQDVPVIEQRNNYRLRAYHRADLSLSFVKKKARFERRWIVSVYNVYNRINPFYVDLVVVDGQRKLREYGLFPIIPSISYVFKF